MSNSMKTVGIYTLGCKVNQYESEAIAERLSEYGFTVIPPSTVCDAYVINTCTVTAESDRKAKQFIRRAIKKNPTAIIAVTGCLAEASQETVAAIVGVDAIIGNTKKLLCADIINELYNKGIKNKAPEIHVGSIDSAPFEEMTISTFERTRAYIKIEDGCENRCTYCIIPSARGRVRSKAPEAVLLEVEGIVRGGCQEVVLTGIETASYGKDIKGTSLCELLEAVDRIDGICRVRLGSLDPSLIKEGIAERISALSSVCPHFHLSLQSGSDRVLALMKRKYNSEQAMRAIEALKKYIPNVKFTTDVIVGFPSETEEDFLKTCDFVRRAGFLQVHIFPYSKRAGTPAATMDGQVPETVKKERLHRLEAIAKDIRKELLTAEVQKGGKRSVLFETFKDGSAYGHTPDFLEICVPSCRPLHGEIFDVKLTHTDGNLCFGEII